MCNDSNIEKLFASLFLSKGVFTNRIQNKHENAKKTVVTFVVDSSWAPLSRQGVIWRYSTPHVRGRQGRAVAGVFLEAPALLHHRGNRQSRPHRPLLPHWAVGLLADPTRHFRLIHSTLILKP